MTRSVRLFGSLIIVFVVLAVSEVFAGLVCHYLAQKYGIPLYQPHLTESYEQYQARLNPALGWDASRLGKDYYDTSGSRPVPAFPDPNRYPACVSLYGDSFVEGIGVDSEHAWSNILSILLNSRCENYGVAGYGTDQAYLKYKSSQSDRAKLVILGFLTENIQRNVNQFRNLLSPTSQCFTKPRFLLHPQGQLSLVPIPAISKEEYHRLAENPERVFSHDYFMPGGPAGFQKAEFPYLWRIFQTSGILLRRAVWGIQPYQELYRPGHPSQALELTVAIIEAFAQTARERGQQHLVLIIPTVADVGWYLRHQKWVYQPLLSLLTERHIEYLDVGPEMIHYLNGADPKTLYDFQNQYHFNVAGNRFLAQDVHRYLTGKNFSPYLPGVSSPLTRSELNLR